MLAENVVRIVCVEVGRNLEQDNIFEYFSNNVNIRDRSIVVQIIATKTLLCYNTTILVVFLRRVHGHIAMFPAGC